eukprot:scaffold16659_cov70-Phaeocystis_antarctica.AAC.5
MAVQTQKVQRANSVSVTVLFMEIQKHLCEETVEHDLLILLANEFQAQRMGLAEFCVRLRMLVGAAVLMATVRGLSGLAAGASPRAYTRACRNDNFRERPAKRSLVKEEVASPAVAMGNGSATSPRKRRASCCGNSVGKAADKAADQAKLAVFLLNKYGAGASRLVAAEAVATSADEEVVCEGEKTREERDAELRGEAVSLDE